MADMDAQTMQEFREIFQLVDLDHGGTIDKDELAVLMQTCQIQVTQEGLDEMVEEIDIEGTGEISFEAFVEAMSKKLKTQITRSELMKAFQVFVGKDGTSVSVDQLIDILVNHGNPKKRLSKEDATERVHQVVHQKKGTIDLLTLLDNYFE